MSTRPSILQVARKELQHYVSMQRDVAGRCPQHLETISTRFGDQQSVQLLYLQHFVQGGVTCTASLLLVCETPRPVALN